MLLKIDKEIGGRVAFVESFLLPSLGVLVVWQLVVWLEDLLVDSFWVEI